MPFVLRGEESFPDGVRRIAHEQLTAAADALAVGTGDRDTDIHSARKAMKRMRGLIRLIASDLGRDIYRLENATYRNAAGQLAALRDASVLLTTLDLVAGDLAAADRPLHGVARAALEARRQQTWEAASSQDARKDDLEHVIENVTTTLLAADARVDDWPVQHSGWKTVVSGLVGGYREGRGEYDTCSWQPTTEALHQWRKRVKYLYYQTQILNPLWPAIMRAWHGELDRLGGMLGDDHDLAVLAGTLKEDMQAAAQAEPLLAAIGARRYSLQREAQLLGMRIYAERPRDLRRRLRTGWRVWKEERLQQTAGVELAPAPFVPLASGPKVERVADTCCRTGEGPLWHAAEAKLYWVDIPAGQLYRFDPAIGSHEMVYEAEGAIGGFTVQADGGLLLFLSGGAVAIWRQGEPLQYVIDGIDVERGSRFNDVIADPAGRVYCGTMAQAGEGGRLYRLDTDGSLTELLDGIGCSNGMGFSPDQRFLYFIDSPTKQICRFAWDEASGELRHRQVHVDTQQDEGVPDGMTVDGDGFLWCARWGGGCLVRYDPDGDEDQRFVLPARKVSSAAFGGAQLDELYVTTAGGDDRAAEGDGAGALFRLQPGVRGKAEFLSRVCL